MENKILLGMLGGFLGFTLIAITAVFAFSVDFSFASPKKLITQQQTNPIKIDGPIVTPAPITEKKQLPASAPESTSSEKTMVTIESSTLYSLINAHRKEHNLSALRVYSALELSARKKLEEMRANNYWRHENPEGIINWEIFEQSGYHFSTAGENLSFANNSPWDVFNSWVNSSTHNQQLLTAEYEDMGVASDCENYQEAGQKKCAVVLHLGRQQ